MASRGLRADVSKCIGDLLLRGYAMLAENCPSCPVPLMKDPRSGDRLCVNCETVYRAGAPLEPPASRSTASTSQGTSAHQHPPQQQPIANGTHAHDSEDESSDFGDDTVAGPVEGRQEDGPLDPRDDPLVFGPFARGTPAAASSSGAGPSTAAAAAAEGSPRTAALPVQGAQQPLAGGGQQGAAVPGLRPLDPQTVAARERERERSDRNAELIGQRLLQGWALLDASCPRCDTPLVRQRTTRRMFCVDCDMWVMTEEEAAAAAASAPAPATPPPTSPSGPASSSSGTGLGFTATAGRGAAGGTTAGAAGAQQGVGQQPATSAVNAVQALLSQRQAPAQARGVGLSSGVQPEGLATQHLLASSAAVDEGLLESVVVHSLERTLLSKLCEAEAALSACPLTMTSPASSADNGHLRQQGCSGDTRGGVVWEPGVQGSLQVMQVIKESVGLLKMLKELRGPTRAHSSSGA